MVIVFVCIFWGLCTSAWSVIPSEENHHFVRYLISDAAQELIDSNPDKDLIRYHLKEISQRLKVRTPPEQILPELYRHNILRKIPVHSLLLQLMLVNQMQEDQKVSSSGSSG
jgi:hypothetical protein